MSKIYLFKAPKKTDDGLIDFLNYLSMYLDSPELYAEDDTLASYVLGDFIKEYSGVVCDYIPALVVMDENENATEYYCFSDPETLKHEKLTPVLGYNKEIITQTKAMKKALESAMTDDDDTETWERFYNSTFKIEFDDKVSNQVYRIDLYNSAQFYELISSTLIEIIEIANE